MYSLSSFFIFWPSIKIFDGLSQTSDVLNVASIPYAASIIFKFLLSFSIVVAYSLSFDSPLYMNRSYSLQSFNCLFVILYVSDMESRGQMLFIAELFPYSLFVTDSMGYTVVAMFMSSILSFLKQPVKQVVIITNVNNITIVFFTFYSSIFCGTGS